MGAPAQRETQHRALRVLSIALVSILLGSILGIVFGDPSSADVNEAASRSAQNMLSVGNTHACVVMSSGGVKCWGRNHKYQTGDGFPLTERQAPVDVEDSTEATGFLTGVSSVSLGYDFSCVVTTAESAKCWGANASGQATGSNVQSVSNPTDVVNLTSGVAAFSAGMNHSCALLSVGGVQCWGSNSYGQLGDGTSTSRKTPGDVSGLTSGVVAVSAGFEHSCAALATGSVKCWGYDSNGQVGSGSPGSSAYVKSPVTVANVSGAVGVTTGKLHSCALTATGVVKCWGRDDLLGTGNTAGVASGAVDVSGLTTGVVALAAGEYDTCALLSDGTVKCWGLNITGAVGDGTTSRRYSPVQVSGLPSAAIAVTVGSTSACALTENHGLWCWGQGFYGQLGQQSQADSTVPVQVFGLSSWVGPDVTPPTVSISRSGAGSMSTGDTETINFTMSEAAVGFDLSDVVATNATLSALAGSGSSWSATLTPDLNSSGNITIAIAQGAFTDGANNPNDAATSLVIPFDTTTTTTTTSTTTSTTTTTTIAVPPPVVIQPPDISVSTTTTASTTTTPTIPDLEDPAESIPGVVKTITPTGNVMSSVVSEMVRSDVVVITIRNDDGSELTIRHRPTVVETAFDVSLGSVLEIAGAGYVENSPVDIWLNSTPRHLGHLTTDETGSFESSVTVPSDVTVGAHTLQIDGISVLDSISTRLGISVSDPSESMVLPITGRDDSVTIWALFALVFGVIVFATRRLGIAARD